jgi:hypothetical protein
MMTEGYLNLRQIRAMCIRKHRRESDQYLIRVTSFYVDTGRLKVHSFE